MTGLVALAVVALPPRWLAARGPGALAWRNRIATLAFVASFLGISLGWLPDPRARAAYQYLFVITLGYGHLLGAAVFSRRRLRERLPEGLPRRPLQVLVGVTIAMLLVLHAAAVAASPVFFFAMLLLSSWHIFENDLGLERAYRSGLRLGAIPRDADHHLVSLALTVAVAAVSWATIPSFEIEAAIRGTLVSGISNAPGRVLLGALAALLLRRHGFRPLGGLGAGLAMVALVLPADLATSRWFGFSEVFSAVTLYHLVSWLVFFGDRERRAPPGVPRAWPLLLGVHVVPAAACLAVFFHAGPDSPLAFWALSPAIYLFWSVLHVLQTAVVRGLEPQRAAIR